MREQIFGCGGVPAGISIAPEIDGLSSFRQIVNPVQAAKVRLPDSEASASLRLCRRGRCAAVLLSVDANVPTGHSANYFTAIVNPA